MNIHKYNYKHKKKEYFRKLVNRYKMKYGCKECGFKEFPEALHLDHIEPKNKFKSLTAIINCHGTFKKVREEIRKCQILCAICHIKKSIKNGDMKHKLNTKINRE